LGVWSLSRCRLRPLAGSGRRQWLWRRGRLVLLLGYLAFGLAGRWRNGACRRWGYESISRSERTCGKVISLMLPMRTSFSCRRGLQFKGRVEQGYRPASTLFHLPPKNVVPLHFRSLAMKKATSLPMVC
jgi:hypothetical protein